MPGDLNIKKSWHPALAKNKLKVEQAEKSAVEDLKAKEARDAEIQKVRELEELKALQTGIPSKVGWMYDDSKAQPANENIEHEIRNLIKKKPKKKRPAGSITSSSSSSSKSQHASGGSKIDKNKADPMAKFLKR